MGKLATNPLPKRRKPLAVDASGESAPRRRQKNRGSDSGEPLIKVSRAQGLRLAVPVLAAVLLVTLYAYWPTLVWMEDTWRREPDYSHGYLVLPLALMLCWNRWDEMPGLRRSPSWSGLWLIGLAVGMRWLSRLVYADFLDAWSLLPLLAGAVWFIFGFPVMKWSLPPIAFLFFMMPLPYQAESLLSWKLQGVATELSTIMLRILGQPAVSEGHMIWINDQQLQVEEACSGLRIFIGVAALAFFWAAMVRRSWLDRLVLIAATIPLAVLVNATRIAVVGLLYQHFDTSLSQHRIHDISGYLMIPLAFGSLWLVKLYWEQLYRPVEQLTAKDIVPGSLKPS